MLEVRKAASIRWNTECAQKVADQLLAAAEHDDGLPAVAAVCEAHLAEQLPHHLQVLPVVCPREHQDLCAPAPRSKRLLLTCKVWPTAGRSGLKCSECGTAQRVL